MAAAMPPPPRAAEALTRLDEITRRLRRECPWDREQDERSIVPHTVEEAYELADAAHAGDDAKLLDELGDVLFQVHFLALLLEERGAGDLASVVEHSIAKLVRRHPHVFADVRVSDADEVLHNWEQIKEGEGGRTHGIFGELPDNLPALLYARKVERRVAKAANSEHERSRLAADGGGTREQRFDAIGSLLLSVVRAARTLDVDPELALRAAADALGRSVEP